ncbi:MAG: undecaprenyldiphospho-muramoylpentapeptide beta-N-acetylglucosaminyltransferase [Planctomycetota bacterium]|jgi:UDP-N-acetylglucosamine--N-acetylmuramyl-(pentapeptide) pyrophosphoryl-undecaprenol N-acetylglucosamine transferase
MSSRSFFFAGGGTGGHIYPSIAVAEQIEKIDADAKIHFFVSSRALDARVLSKTDFEYTTLPAKGFSLQPDKLIGFCVSFLKSCQIAKEVISASSDSVVIGAGGFVSAPVCFAAHKIGSPVVLLDVDVLPGRANKIFVRWADKIFVQFEETVQYFANKGAKVNVMGCPLRRGFENPQPDKVIEQLGLDKNKKTLLITGASSGSENINRAVCSLLSKLDAFSDNWQIVHLTGISNYEKVKQAYTSARISNKILDYFEDMSDLLSACDLVIGRSGAVSVAEFAAAGVPSICMPYPYHRNRHQYLNAGKLVKAGAAVIVDDLPDEKERAERLWKELEQLLKDDDRRQEMKKNCTSVAKRNAASEIAKKLLKTGVSE